MQAPGSKIILNTAAENEAEESIRSLSRRFWRM